MGELRQEFLAQTIFRLETLQKEFLDNSEGILSEDFLRRLFRQLHTIKGTSSTFKLNGLATLAHEIENLLQAVQNHQIPQNIETNSVFQQSFEQLLKTARNPENIVPDDFSAKIRSLIPNLPDTFSRQIPDQLIPDNLAEILSWQEKNFLHAALKKGQTFYLLEAVFDLSAFYEDFKQFKQMLNENGEVIAVSPLVVQNPTREIGFQIFFVSNLSKAGIEKLTASYSSVIKFEKTLQNNFSNDVPGVIARIIAEGESIAQTLNKRISFETSFDEIMISKQNLILLNEVASHLLRNAIDHGTETAEERIKTDKNPAAKIKISVSALNSEILLQIEDDGKGIDIEQITKQAQQKNLISSDRILNEKEAIELIFSSGFSTTQNVSEFSGRGIGLDAVKDLVEKAGGRLEIQTKRGFGTSFSIYLPQT